MRQDVNPINKVVYPICFETLNIVFSVYSGLLCKNGNELCNGTMSKETLSLLIKFLLTHMLIQINRNYSNANKDF